MADDPGRPAAADLSPASGLGGLRWPHRIEGRSTKNQEAAAIGTVHRIDTTVKTVCEDRCAKRSSCSTG
jgi:hypothetical protein